MKTSIFLFFLCFYSAFAVAQDLRPLNPNQQTVRDDLKLILEQAKIPNTIDFDLSYSTDNISTVICSPSKVTVSMRADHRWSQTFYMTLQQLGFLFPHPRLQISPSLNNIRQKCGKSFKWNPALKYSGFHLHTLHPSEWVHGFLMGNTAIAIDTVRWFARNQQNIFDLSLLDIDNKVLFRHLKAPFQLAKDFGIHTGVTLGFAFKQQNSYRLISFFSSFFESLSMKELDENLNNLISNLDLSFLNLESGTSEFTPTNYELSLKWMNRAAQIAAQKNIAVLMKIHTSSNQKNDKYGNFNFLPGYADPSVGVLPHTVFVYALEEENAPMYGNRNFAAIKNFMLEQKDKRRTWFYPETSYFCGLDIDAPLWLTDFLLTRARDTRFLYEQKIEGQLNFTTGHELGYWLFDWTFALLNNLDYQFNPSIGLRLLGEDIQSWQSILDFQNKYFIKKGLVSIITFSTLGDELLPGLHQTLQRNLLKDLSKDSGKLENEIADLKEALAHLPANFDIKNRELALMWDITKLRIQHALQTRLAMLEKNKREDHLKAATYIRVKAQENIDALMKNYSRYPEALIFKRHENPTAYKWGYGYLASDLYYWRREEEAIRQENYHFYFMPAFSFQEVLDGWVL